MTERTPVSSFFMRVSSDRVVTFYYTNHEGVRELRKVIVRDWEIGYSAYHRREVQDDEGHRIEPPRRVFLRAFCLDRMADRTFLVDDIELDTFKVHA